MKIWVGRALVVVLILVSGGGSVIAHALHKARECMDRRIAVAACDLAVPNEAAAIERGKYLFSTRGCVDYHGADGAGRAFIDDGSMRVEGANISPGPGSVVAKSTPADWERSLRHGVKADGRLLMIMPSEDYNRLTDADLGALVAHIRQLPPAAGGAAEVVLPLPLRVRYGRGQVPDAASVIDHQHKPSLPVAEGVSVEHGAHVSAMCIGCHGEHLSGGKIPGGPPDWPPAPNLRPGEGSLMPRDTDAQALPAMMRQGEQPNGKAIALMPFDSFKHIADTNVAALHLYLKSSPGPGCAQLAPAGVQAKWRSHICSRACCRDRPAVAEAYPYRRWRVSRRVRRDPGRHCDRCRPSWQPARRRRGRVARHRSDRGTAAACDWRPSRPAPPR